MCLAKTNRDSLSFNRAASIFELLILKRAVQYVPGCVFSLNTLTMLFDIFVKKEEEKKKNLFITNKHIHQTSD